MHVCVCVSVWIPMRCLWSVEIKGPIIRAYDLCRMIRSYHRKFSPHGVWWLSMWRTIDTRKRGMVWVRIRVLSVNYTCFTATLSGVLATGVPFHPFSPSAVVKGGGSDIEEAVEADIMISLAYNCDINVIVLRYNVIVVTRCIARQPTAAIFFFDIS